MTRALEPATKAALDKPELPLAVIVSLDILNDPLFAWTGIGDLTFGATETGDPSLDGKTFDGIGSIIEISNVSDQVGGSDAMELVLPGVNLNEPILRQLITNRNAWQFRRAVVWLVVLDSETMEIAGKPFRIKTGRIDQMPYTENNKSGTVKCKIEGQQSYGNTPLASRYSEQIDINANDNSQSYVHSLANMTASLGQASTQSGFGARVAGTASNMFTNQSDYR